MSDVHEPEPEEDPQGPAPAVGDNPALGHARPHHLATDEDKAAEEG